MNSGFWRAKYTSSQIHECLFSPACKGGTTWIDSYNYTWPTECDAGYGGNLCHACVRHDGVMYTRSNKHGNNKISHKHYYRMLEMLTKLNFKYS